MSVPVRYSAAAEYAVVDSGLSNTLTQEEQYHIQQQQQQQQQLYCHLYSNNISNVLEQQQQLMQQRSSMSMSVSPNNSSANIIANHINNNNINNSSNNKMAQQASSPLKSSSLSNPLSMDDMKPTTSAMAMAATGNDSVNAEMQTDWMRMSDDEGRYGTPGAAGLDYQKYELEQQQLQQQQQQQLDDETATGNNNSNNDDQPMDNENTNNNNSNANSNAAKNLEEELNAMTTDELYNKLREYDALQDKYHTVLLLPKDSRREVTAGGRDGSAYVLRCLKMWYELPSDVLFSAMSLVDRFLDRMAVKPKHMACMSVASFHLAIKQLELKPIPAEDLVTISQCGCTAGDLERMTGVIANKLGVQMGHGPVTSVSFLRIYYALFRNLAKEIGGDFFRFYKRFIKLQELENRLENLLCDVKTTVVTPSTLALVLISLHLDFHIKESYTRGRPELKHVFDYILFLQQFMRIPDRVFTCGFSVCSGILSHYNNQNKQPYKQRLVWRLSSRTLRVLRPTNRFSSDLPTIEEGVSNAMDDGLRSRTESISSEEEEDWPTSPIIPIFEQC